MKRIRYDSLRDVCVRGRETKRENVMCTSVGKIWVTLIERKLANAIVCIV